MFTPQEVSEKVFPKASFGGGGYNMASVDEFLDALTEDYTALFKENVTLKAKLKVLAEKVEEYRATEDSMRDTLRWLDACQDLRHIKPILTPRFTPSCTNELMAFLGKLAAERDLPVQSHLSENGAEMDWVRQLHPDCRQYWETYKKYDLWNDRTVMAHCVWSDERERQAMKDAGVTVVHCADSNQNLCSGVAPVRRMLDEGVKVALGSDIAGGDHLDMFDVTAAAVRASKARRMMDGWSTPFLTVAEGWYLATSAGAAFFGEQPGQPRTLTPAERLERAVYRRQEGAVQAVWSAGRKIYAKP